jgi:hypothetical protein
VLTLKDQQNNIPLNVYPYALVTAGILHLISHTLKVKGEGGNRIKEQSDEG